MEKAATKPSEDEITGGWFLALDAENGTMKNACPYQNKFGEKNQQKYKWYCGNCKVIEFIV